MIDLISWALAVEALGLIALPVTFVLFSRLPYGGYAFSKALGILLFSFLVWMVGFTGIVPLNRYWVWGVALVLAAASFLVVCRRLDEFRQYVREQRWTIVIVDVLFLAAFAGWAAARAYDPAISHTEQPMDFALLNSVIRAESMPPQDPWLSGHSVSYYYFGYVMHGVLAKVTGVEAAVAYNLAIALLFSLSAVGAFGLVSEMVGIHRRKNGDGREIPVAVGLLAALLVVGIGNLQSVAEMVRAWGVGGEGVWSWIGVEGATTVPETSSWFSRDFWWWWRTTRVIQAAEGGSTPAITEFPSFSFILGDLHPHVMSLPFLILALGLGLRTLASGETFRLRWMRENKVGFAVIALCIGGLGFLNSWDLPLGLGLFLGTTLIANHWSGVGWGREQMKSWGLFAGALVAAVVVLYLPFYLGDRPSPLFPWVLPVEGVHTRFIHYFLVVGLFLLISVPFLLALTFRYLRSRTDTERLWHSGTLLVLAPFAIWAAIVLPKSLVEGDVLGGLDEIGARVLGTFPLLLVLGLALWLILKLGLNAANESRAATTFALILVFAGLLATLGPELFRIVDVFGNRMNTVFKFYYQAWIMLGAASAFGIYYMASGWDWSGIYRRTVGTVAVGLIGLLIVASAMFTLGALNNKTNSFSADLTLNGLAFLGGPESPETRALAFISEDSGPESVIVEAVAVDDRGTPGGDYRLDYARIAGRTGVPTILGWAGHEEQWRGSRRGFRERSEDVRSIYTEGDVSVVEALLEKYGVEYVYVGGLERDSYGLDTATTFDEFMDRAFESGQITIYKVREN